jgi:hypothetical protein
MFGLVHAAVFSATDQIVGDLPSQFVALLRDWSAHPPASVERTPQTFYGGPLDGLDSGSEEERANARFLTYEGLWRWHRYFRDQTE